MYFNVFVIVCCVGLLFKKFQVFMPDNFSLFFACMFIAFLRLILGYILFNVICLTLAFLGPVGLFSLGKLLFHYFQ